MAKELSDLQPEVLGKFSEMCGEVYDSSGLDDKTIEMIVIGVAIAVKCKPCINHHVKKFKELGGSLEELAGVGACSAMMGGGPGTAYANIALDVYQSLE